MSRYANNLTQPAIVVLYQLNPEIKVKADIRLSSLFQLIINCTLDNDNLCVLLPVFQYLGSTSVTRTHGTGSTDDAVKTIVQDVRQLVWNDVIAFTAMES